MEIRGCQSLSINVWAYINRMLVPWGSGAKFGNAMDFMSVVWLSIIGVWEWKNLDEICPNFAFCPTNQIPCLLRN